MRPICQSLARLVVLGIFAALPAQAESFHTCGTIINSVPTVISAQGVYCLTHDVTTAITSGSAIDIQTNNVTIDCNGYKLGGLAAGASSNSYGVFSFDRQNITVRNCGIRGFRSGISLAGVGAGQLVEDNRLDNNLVYGIVVSGDNNRVRRNAVYDTGGHSPYVGSEGIFASADVIDNTVAGVFGAAADVYPMGIHMFGSGTEARGNQIRGLATAGAGYAIGLVVETGIGGITLDRNRVSASSATAGWGIFGNGATDTFCTGNTVAKFNSAIVACQDAGGNASN
jgi:parallel beta-helix repeat protein